MPEGHRTCGSCTACCHSLVIEELDKPAFTECAHACGSSCANAAGCDADAEAGCDIYEDRPDSCRGFRCLWLDGHLGEDDRPDRLGVIFTTAFGDDIDVHPLLVEYKPGVASSKVIEDAVDRLTEKTRVLVLTPAGGTLHPRKASGDKVTSTPTPLTIDGQAA